MSSTTTTTITTATITAATITAATPTSTATTSQPGPGRPDLTRYRQAHRCMRASNELLVAGVDALPMGDRRRAAAIRRWFVGYAGELRAHHHVEDDLFFPTLAAVTAEFAQYESALAADHDRLDVVLDGLEVTLGRLAAGGQDWSTVAARALELAVELRDLLAVHLDVEDHDVLPMFERHLTAEEYAALDEQVLQEISPRQLLFTVPWFAATVTPDEARAELGAAPLPIRAIWYATRGRYARLVRRAFGDAAETSAAASHG